ncbi:hypothetical protein Tco_0439769 [Tanacetum coccineum]
MDQNVFLKEREQYFEIQDLKAQLQDKNISISELKKHIEKNKGKDVDTNSEKNNHILGDTAFATNQKSSECSLHLLGPQVKKTSFAKHYDVNALGTSRNSPKHHMVYMETNGVESLLKLVLSWIKEQVENGIIELYFVRTEYQLADMFTKALPEDRFQYLVRRIGMRCLTPAELEVLANESA